MTIANKLRAVGMCRPLTRELSLRPFSTTSIITARAPRLSAIHRGLRQSEKATFGERWPSRDASSKKSRDTRGGARTSKALEGAASWRQQQKLRKKLDRKAADDEDEESGRQTRRKRFLDPESNFGKKSLVYQLKHGELKERAASLDLQEPVRPAPRPYNDRSRPWGPASRNEKESARPASRPYNDRSRPQRTAPTKDVRQSRPADDDDSLGKAEFKGRGRGMMPMTIHYTTAASQFLYGRSVVKAALEQARRKLYKLYIYGGENRKDSKDNDIMMALARRHGVPIKIVPNEEQRLMDKMSMGRPHNGFVLETSPLPQPPVQSLGKLEESPTRLGFHVLLDHQTREEEMVNGTDTFVPRSNDVTPKPFVLLLDEILDPGNLGALLRTASYLGVDAVGITSRNSSTLTPVVLKSAAGAAEELSIFTVDSPVQFIEDSKKAGWKTYAAVAPPDRKLVKRHGDKFISTDAIEKMSPLERDPCVLILGNEGHGLSKPIKVAADYEVSVPRFVQGSSVDSLNVSVAAGLLCHSFVKGSMAEAVAPVETRRHGRGGEGASVAEQETDKGESIF
ncbi:23S rRNA (guanosine(2251)-2'-O)-methyltransferase [Purpureocillium takamizusanense]|uniref:rRNA methyltransferase 1, mitochondrial n=1 Tax=Purpureocillium takamizusanense TaxID=2060973 RepID=A0A9Q8VD62_9HYPO|nr:23S rRNA (guanosine(2251)-2'-O)-methyltransferase [Purpureocillium takamizusanense]UNI20584.1 23S rRNA (guanosine(2251)-2'-O)-methyltransferase [Purpureocillium takamizusanense]